MMVRCFLAIELPEPTLNELQELRSRIVLPQFDVRWVKLENIHLTVRFFGEIPFEDIKRLSEAIRLGAQEIDPFRIVIKGVGAFPNIGNPRVIWTGIEDPAPIVRLEQSISKELDQISWPPPDKPFRPHMTLGRVRSDRGRRELRECVERNKDTTVGEFQANHISLIKSDLHRAGPLYTVLDRFCFSQSPTT